MKLTHLLASAAFGAACLAGCQPPPATDEQAPAATETLASEETSAATEASATSPALPCGIVAQRNWEAETSAGSPATLTVSGEIDLGSPGYGVSLARDASEAAGATTAMLSLALRPPTSMNAQVVTPHPVRYFGPAGGAYEDVQIMCDGVALTTIPVAR